MSQPQYSTVDVCNNHFWFSPGAALLRMALHNLIRIRDGESPFTGRVEIDTFKARIICGVIPEDWQYVAEDLSERGMVGFIYRDGPTLVLDVSQVAYETLWNPDMQYSLDAYLEKKSQAGLLAAYHADRGTDPSVPAQRVPIPRKIKRLILDRDNHTCQHCGTTENLAIDHIIPVVRGGGNELTNLQVLCMRCNTLKGTSV